MRNLIVIAALIGFVAELSFAGPSDANTRRHSKAAFDELDGVPTKAPKTTTAASAAVQTSAPSRPVSILDSEDKPE